MYRIIYYYKPRPLESDAEPKTPATWFDGVYSKNTIPFPIFYNKKKMVHPLSKEIILKEGQRYIELNLSELLRIESTPQGANVFFEDKTYWSTKKSIEEFEAELESHLFFRISENHLVNLKYIDRLIKCDAIITMSNMDVIPVDTTKEKLMKFLEGKKLL